MKLPLLRTLLVAAIGCLTTAHAADGPTPVRTLGPTGLEIYLQKDNTIKVAKVQAGSPAEGKFTKGQVITAINGKSVPDGFWEHRRFLGDQITAAEASDGNITFTTKTGEVTVSLPVLGSFSPTWPVDCPKTDKIIAANATYLRHKANKGELSKPKMTDALGILALLSTGEEQDLEVVRDIYKSLMEDFQPEKTGANTWHLGHQGIAACEYYLRTGDESVLPYINAICDAARRYQVQGGWYHWATAANPKYGVVNATGTNMLTTLLLAKHCGAEVDDDTLLESLRFFYRFVGHGTNAYGNGRPETGLGSNGKTEQIAAAMQIAAKSNQPAVYAMARDHAASAALYDYPAMLGGHTGPIGLIWYNPIASLMMEKEPGLYRSRQDQVRWWYELSRQFDGSFVMSSGRGYDDTEYGHATVLGLTAPRRQLQIFGAPASKFGKSFSLPERPWGRPADTAFLTIDGSPNYKPLVPVPHIEFEKIKSATKGQLRQIAGHPRHAYRQAISGAIRAGGHYDLIEELLVSKNPLERHTGCLSINQFEPWRLRYSKRWASADSIEPEQFTQTMFDRLVAMVKDPDGPIWLVDQALLAMALAKPEQTAAVIDTITPWLNHDEWWFYESATIALSPVLQKPELAAKVMPLIAKVHATMEHARAQGTVTYLLMKNADSMPEESRKLAGEMLRAAYADIPTQTWEEGTMDLSAITSIALATSFTAALEITPELAPALAAISAERLKDLSPRERGIHIDSLVQAAKKLPETERKKVGEVLNAYYRSAIFDEYGEVLSPDYKGSVSRMVTPLNKVIDIDQLAGKPTGWKLLDQTDNGIQDWLYASFDPAEKLKPEQHSRYRKVTLPAEFSDWFKPDYQPDPARWAKVSAKPGATAPESYRKQPVWKTAPHLGGEVSMVRKTIEIDDLDQVLLRLCVFSRQGYCVYVNGTKVFEQSGRSKNWQPRITYAKPGDKLYQALKPGTNLIAVTSFLQYFRGKEGDLEVYLEGLKKLPKP